MGEEGYAELVLRCEAHLDTVKRARSAGARQLIPLLVHPATVAAGTVGGRRTRVPRKRGRRTASPGANEPAHPVPPSKPTRRDQAVGRQGVGPRRRPAPKAAGEGREGTRRSRPRHRGREGRGEAAVAKGSKPRRSS